MALSTPDSHAPQQNHLLDALPIAEREPIYPHLQLVEMPLGKVVYEPGDLPRYAYFPTDCIVSLLYILAVSKLQRLGVIDHSRGHITVLDGSALERLSCECYAVVKKETDRLLPYPRGEQGPASSIA